MGYKDAQGRPELVMDPHIKLGLVGYRIVSVPPDDNAETPADDAEPAAADDADRELSASTTTRRRSPRR